ncbi:MAG TPA: hypothetical protein PKK40_09140 [Marmoricola sp.]|nr:hypothetical protein [Marmoricola sp.]
MITEREINGVRCFGVEQPGKLPKELLVQFILRSGVRDQAFHEEELAHLVEHILLSAVDDSEITVQGRPDSPALT